MILFFGALVVLLLLTAWLMAKTDSWPSGTPPMSEPETTYIGMTTSTENLSDADREAALAQGMCPVMGVPLSEAVMPVKINHDGRIVYVCCSACVPLFECDPDRYLKKLQ